LATDLSLYVSGIYDGKIKTFNSGEIENNQFTVYGENGKFNWIVFGSRGSIDVEPKKNNVLVNGQGPYRWIN
jgi:hypothetical protein